MNEKKVKRYIYENRVSPLYRNNKVEKYVVEGDTGTWTVRHDILKDMWTCNCPNVRLSECIHIACCKRFKK